MPRCSPVRIFYAVDLHQHLTRIHAGRCEELKCPLLALKVFGDHTKYGFGLTSVAAGRQLLHSLYDRYPLENAMTAASLFGVYRLPFVASDLSSCAMLYVACVKNQTPNAQLVAKSLKRQLNKRVVLTEKINEPTQRLVRAQHPLKPTLWLAKTIRQIKSVHRECGLPSPSFLEMWKAEGKQKKRAATSTHNATL